MKFWPALPSPYKPGSQRERPPIKARNGRTAMATSCANNVSRVANVAGLTFHSFLPTVVLAISYETYGLIRPASSSRIIHRRAYFDNLAGHTATAGAEQCPYTGSMVANPSRQGVAIELAVKMNVTEHDIDALA